jgi:Asp-tRNA(Asn)/Glu-tRNA(Gln) amidotransferase A subunit family amidase
VQRLRAAGAVLVGNTTTPEFLMAYETDNRLTGRTSNPWNMEFSSGGSSGGEAAAIASGCSAGGVGSDGGGSIRVPAQFCGICGLKPTPGRIPASGHYPAGVSAFGWLGVVGPMARTVGDLKIMFEVMSRPDPGDRTSAPVQGKDAGLDPGPTKGHSEKLRVGILQADALGRVAPETQSAVRRAAQHLAYSGFKLEPFRLNHLERVVELWWFFFGTVIGELFQSEIRGREHLLSPVFRDYLEAARPAGSKPMSMSQFVGMCAARDRERERILEAMRDVPILLSPVSVGPAFRHGEGGYMAGVRYRESMRHSQWLNLVGVPGVTVPMGRSAEGLPVGVQLIGRPFEDELVLDVAERLEEARGPWEGPDL